MARRWRVHRSSRGRGTKMKSRSALGSSIVDPSTREPLEAVDYSCGTETEITFVNRCRGPVDIFWRREDGEGARFLPRSARTLGLRRCRERAASESALTGLCRRQNKVLHSPAGRGAAATNLCRCVLVARLSIVCVVLLDQQMSAKQVRASMGHRILRILQTCSATFA
jgi:hypothetical protein